MTKKEQEERIRKRNAADNIFITKEALRIKNSKKAKTNTSKKNK